MRHKLSLLQLDSVHAQLLKAYALFLATRQLWLNAALSAKDGIFAMTQKCLQTTLGIFPEVLGAIEPCGGSGLATRVLSGAFEELTQLALLSESR
jgi:hypothetical protein